MKFADLCFLYFSDGSMMSKPSSGILITYLFIVLIITMIYALRYPTTEQGNVTFVSLKKKSYVVRTIDYCYENAVKLSLS